MYTKEQIAALVDKYGYIKVNIPDSIESFRKGNGEGVWAVVSDDESHKLYHENAHGGQITVACCNDSVYYPGEIVFGKELICLVRGKDRPIVVWDTLNGTTQAMENKKKTIKKLMGE